MDVGRVPPVTALVPPVLHPVEGEWQYVPVERRLLFLEHSISVSLQWVVFEPNDSQLWGQVRTSVSEFLDHQWRAGVLQGATPEQAYFVRCDQTTMTQNDLANGRLVVVVGVAPITPAEFVVVQIGQWTHWPPA